jgi:hypothetical protein
LLELDEAALGADATADAGSVPAPADGQMLPTELQALLDGKEAEPEAPPAEPGPERDRAMADDVAEAEFYLSQGMAEEARAVHRRMQHGTGASGRWRARQAVQRAQRRWLNSGANPPRRQLRPSRAGGALDVRGRPTRRAG